jgi:hypothetical protein
MKPLVLASIVWLLVVILTAVTTNGVALLGTIPLTIIAIPALWAAFAGVGYVVSRVR